MNPGQSSSYSPSLAPGDLAEIIFNPPPGRGLTPRCTEHSNCGLVVGSQVVVLSGPYVPYGGPRTEPLWPGENARDVTSQNGTHSVWERLLRKIQPPPRSELDELLDTFEDQKETLDEPVNT
jgi:hypothetical protein